MGASRRLRITHSTLSKQLRELEESLGAPLFDRNGKRLALNGFGRDARDYAAEIFRLSRELQDFARGRAVPTRSPLRVGVLSSLPKTFVCRLLEPALRASPEGRAQLRQLEAERMVELLQGGRLDLGLLDEVPAETASRGLHAHVLGETELLWYAAPALAARYRRAFPRSLAGAPLVLPPEGTPLRRSLEHWLLSQGIEPLARIECDDAGLLRALATAGHGILPVRAALRAEVEDLHGMRLVGPCEGVRERYFALSRERHVRHPAVALVLEHARRSLLAPAPPSKGRTRRSSGR